MFNVWKKVEEEIGQTEESFAPELLIQQFQCAFVMSTDSWRTADVESNEFSFGITIDLQDCAYDNSARNRIEVVLRDLDRVRDKSGEGALQYITIERDKVTLSYWGIRVNTQWDMDFDLQGSVLNQKACENSGDDKSPPERES